MKKFVKNYDLDLDKNERKIIKSFSNQVLKQTAGNKQLYQIERPFHSILEKVNSDDNPVKFTKDEYFKLKKQLNQNLTYIKKEMKSAWFIKKWAMKSMYKQHSSLIENHFKD